MRPSTPTWVILFDIDGTLLDAGEAGRQALDEAFFKTWDLADASQGVTFAGATDPELIREIMALRLGIAPDQVETGMVRQVLAAYLGSLPRCLASSTRFCSLPGVDDLLRLLHARPDVLVALATGNIAPAARLKLAKAQLNRFFRTGGFGGDAPTRAGIVAKAILRASKIAGQAVPRQHVVVVGDTCRDIKAARAVGCRVVAVCTGGDDRIVLEAAGADLVLDTLAQVDELLAFLGLAGDEQPC